MRAIPVVVLFAAILGAIHSPVLSTGITSKTPSPHQVDVSAATNVSARFDTVLSSATVNDTTFIIYSYHTGKTGGTYSLANNDSTAVFDPSVGFFAGELVDVIMTTNVTSALGNPLNSPVNWRFTVGAQDNGDSLLSIPTWSSASAQNSQGIAWGDIDNDGDLDLVCGNYSLNSTVFRNDGGTLTASPVWSGAAGESTRDIALGDYDGDGDLDLAMANYNQSNVVYRNDAGTFTSSPVWSSTPTNSSYSVAWGDYDGDGDLDLACGNYGQSNTIYRNDGGTLTSSPTWSSAPTRNTYTIAWGDVDGDGDLDLACGQWQQQINLYRNDGGVITDSPDWSSSASPRTRCVVWGDYDGDGDLDLACGNSGQANTIYRNDSGTLTASPVWSSAPSEPTYEVAWGDLDGDGDLDLACANYARSNAVYRNDGGTLTSSPVWTSSLLNLANCLAIGDVDGDGDLDIAFGTSSSDSNTVYYNSRTIEVVSTSPIANSVDAARGTNVQATFNDAMAPATFNDTTFVVHGLQSGNKSGSYSMSNSDTTAVFDPDSTFRAGEVVEVTVTTDVTTSGAIPLSNAYVWRFTGGTQDNGDSLLTYPAWLSTVTSETHAFALGDFDNDGDVDMACTDSGECKVYQNDNGNLEGTLIWTSASGSVNPRALAWGDYDGDGDLDLACGNGGTYANVLYRNDAGSLTTSPVWTSTQTNYTASVEWGDYDGDGDLDLAFGNLYTYNCVYRNDDGVLTTDPAWVSSPTNASQDVAWGDYDGDGDLDLAFANAYSNNTLYRNDGGVLTASPVWSSATAYGTYGLAWGDYDNDGDIDLAFADWAYPTGVHRNDAGTLTTTPVWTSTPTNNTFDVAWGDYDGDGDLDLACGNTSYTANNVYRNNGGVLTSSPAWSSDSTYRTNEIAWADVDNDGDLELVCANGANEPMTMYANASPPEIVSTDPDINDIDVVRDTAVEATFNTPMSLSTFVDSTFVLQSYLRGKLNGSYAASNGDQTITLDPDSVFFAGEIVEAVITDKVASSMGLRMGTPRVWRFTVEAIADGDSLDANAAWASAAGYYTSSVAWGDYDNDGDLDLACGNAFGGSANRLYSNEDGRLDDAGVEISSSIPPTQGLVWGDFDGDGDVDIVCANYGANTIHENTGGNIVATPVWTSTPANNSTSVACADYDGDGDLDLAFGNNGQANTVYRNDGGTFTANPVWTSNPAYYTSCVLWLDYDRDGDLDLFFGNYDDTQANNLYRNDNGVITADPVWSSFVHYYTKDVAAGDYNGDGWVDIVFGNYDQHDELFHNFSGSFVYSGWYTPQTYSTTCIDWVDFDGDGDLDIACGSDDDSLAVYINTGAGIAQTPYRIHGDKSPMYTTSMAWADFDNDGDMDLARGNYIHRDQLFVNGLVVISSNPGKNATDVDLGTDVEGEFNNAVNSSTVSASSFVVYGSQSGLLSGSYSTHTGETYAQLDPALPLHPGETIEAILNGDVTSATGDALTRGHAWQFTAEVPVSDSLLTSPIWSLSGGSNRNVSWGDYDGDGDLDIACGRAGTYVVYANVNGVLSTSPAWTSSDGATAGWVTWVDYDQDGDLDLATADGLTGITLHRNDAGVLTTDPVWSSSIGSVSIDWGDYDGDGDMDMACTNSASSSWSLFRNDDGTLTASPVLNVSTGLYPSAVAWADFDGDWDLDIVSANWDGESYVFENDGGKFVGATGTNPNSYYTLCAAWGDCDGDGNLDIAFGNDGESNVVYEIQSSTMTQVWTSTPANATKSVAWVDYDGDGDLDLAFGNYGQANTIYRNDGGTLTANPVWSTTPTNNTYGMNWGDVNGDGDIDVIYACNEGLFLYGNTDVWPPSPVTDLAVLSTTDSSATLSWTATGDDSTVGTASFYDVRFSNLPITAANFAAADTAGGEPAPQPPGTPETFEVTGLTPGLKYYFVLKVADADSNWSDVSNNASGYVFIDEPEITSITDVPNDQGKQVTVTWDASVTDHNYGVEQYAITEYSVWRWLDTSAMTAEMAAAVVQPVVLRSEEEFAAWYPKRYETPVVDIQFGGFLASGMWLYINSVPALQFESYAVTAPTLADSTGQGIPYHTFMVSAMTADPFVHAESAPDSGYSVDNLTPGAPQNLMLAGADVIVWDPNSEEDLDYYSIYANPSSGADPDPDYLIGSTSDTTFTLPDSVLGYYVFVTAVDFNGNESDPSNEVEWAVGVEDENHMPTVYALHQNVPNPFNPTTTIRFDLPAAARVELLVYNVRGQLVRTLVDEDMSAGVKTVQWNGRDGTGRSVASGIYFYRISAGGFNDTKKMILLK